MQVVVTCVPSSYCPFAQLVQVSAGLVIIPECPAVQKHSWMSVDVVPAVVESAGHLTQSPTSEVCLYWPTAHAVHLSSGLAIVPE